jgi:bifunctional non-homologous end joining protein LigD
VDAALKKGDLKFTLNGYKLKGSWVLVKTSGRYAGSRGGGDRTWLLIKHRDDWSGDLDITEFAPKSVKSDGDFEDILGEDTPAVWQSNRPAKGGDAGAMLATIIERAAKLKAGRAGAKPARAGAPVTEEPTATKTPNTRATRTSAAAVGLRRKKKTPGRRGATSKDRK